MSQDEEELEEIRKRKMMEMQLQQQAAVQDEQVRQEQALAQEQQKQIILRKILSPEAKSRLTRIKLTYPEFATSVEDQLIMLAQSGRLQKTITDTDLKEILKRVQPQRREINIERR